MCTKQDRELAPLAVAQVRHWGGVLEHPAGSTLWEACGLPLPPEDPMRWPADGYGGRSVEVAQVSWGHCSRKLTWLYFVGVDRVDVASTVRVGGVPTHHVSRDAERARRNSYTLKRTSTKQNKLTPVAFAEWLLSLAATARRSA